jgi:FkbM family methyltransferase
MKSESLSELLQEPLESVMHREQHALEELLCTRNNRVVLFGSGNLGRRAAGALQGIGVRPLAFSDNNRERWGTHVDGIEVLPPIRAAELYGTDSVFLVTIWNEFHWFHETAQQLREYGCDQVAPYTSLHWRFSEIFLPCLLNDLPHKLYKESESVLAAENIWSDFESRAIFNANIRLRARGELDGLPGRPTENTYLPTEILSLSDHDRFLDCGATSGEMTQDLIRKRGDHFGLFYALEADNVSFPKLEAYRNSLPEPLQAKLRLINFAVGAAREVVHFAHSGQTGSKISAEGLPVECFPIDELFEDTPLTFIKMDIEGAEYDALRGAAKVIRRDQPILAICVYHTQNDIWRIPLLVREMLPEHRLYLRAYEGDGFQTVMYAVPPDRCMTASLSAGSETNSVTEPRQVHSNSGLTLKSFALACLWTVLILLYVTFAACVVTFRVRPEFAISAFFGGAILCFSLNKSRVPHLLAVATPLFCLAAWCHVQPLIAALMMLGCSGTIVLAFQAASGSQIAKQNFQIAVLLPLSVAYANFFNKLVANLTPNLFDAILLKADFGIGAALRNWTLANSLRLAAVNCVYENLPLMVAIVFAYTKGKARSQLARALCFSAILALPCYLLVPAVGPIHVGDPHAARNCMPSMHLVWAALLWLNARPVWLRRAAFVFTLLTAFAILATGEHYVLDLLAAVPATWMLQKLSESAPTPLQGTAKIQSVSPEGCTPPRVKPSNSPSRP